MRAAMCRWRESRNTASWWGAWPACIHRIIWALGPCLLLLVLPAPGADQETDYQKVIQARTDKLLAPLGLTDTNQLLRVREILMQQYHDLRQAHEGRDARARAIAETSGSDSEKATIKQAREKASAEVAPLIATLHAAFIEKLARELTPPQVDQIKDGMTYGVVPITYAAYLKMYPELTELEKKQIMDWLLEARELAMDQGTSEEKHGVFNKYKGKINNFLSKAGYDSKKGAENLKKTAIK